MRINKQSAHAIMYPFEDTSLHYDEEGGAYIYNYDGSLILCIYEAEYGEDFWWSVFDANTYTVLDNMKFGLVGQPTLEKAIQNFLKKSIYADEFDLEQKAASRKSAFRLTPDMIDWALWNQDGGTYSLGEVENGACFEFAIDDYTERDDSGFDAYNVSWSIFWDDGSVAMSRSDSIEDMIDEVNFFLDSDNKAAMLKKADMDPCSNVVYIDLGSDKFPILDIPPLSAFADYLGKGRTWSNGEVECVIARGGASVRYPVQSGYYAYVYDISGAQDVKILKTEAFDTREEAYARLVEIAGMYGVGEVMQIDRAASRKTAEYDWRNSVDGYYDIWNSLSEDFWTEIDGAYLMLVDDDIFSIEQGLHGEWELSSYNEGRLRATYAKDCDSPQDAVDMANQSIDWGGSFRLPKLGKRFNAKLSEISISLMDGTNNLYEGVDDDGNLVWFEDSGYGGVEWYWSVMDPNTYMPIKKSDYYSSSLDEAIDDYTLATGQAVRVALRKRAEREWFKNGDGVSSDKWSPLYGCLFDTTFEMPPELEGYCSKAKIYDGGDYYKLVVFDADGKSKTLSESCGYGYMIDELNKYLNEIYYGDGHTASRKLAYEPDENKWVNVNEAVGLGYGNGFELNGLPGNTTLLWKHVYEWDGYEDVDWYEWSIWAHDSSLLHEGRAWSESEMSYAINSWYERRYYESPDTMNEGEQYLRQREDRYASNKNATRHFTYAEMQELDDEIEGRELHNANRLRYTTGTELM